MSERFGAFGKNLYFVCHKVKVKIEEQQSFLKIYSAHCY